MKTADWISLFAAAIALLSVGLHLALRARDQRDARHQSVIAALQGSKEAVGYEAYRLKERGWPRVFEQASTHNAASGRNEWDLHRAWPKIAMLGRLLNAPEITAAAERHF